MIVIQSNERTIVLTGWRAWLCGAAALLVAWVAFAILAFALIGLTATVGAMLILLVPAAVAVVALQVIPKRSMP